MTPGEKVEKDCMAMFDRLKPLDNILRAEYGCCFSGYTVCSKAGCPMLMANGEMVGPCRYFDEDHFQCEGQPMVQVRSLVDDSVIY